MTKRYLSENKELMKEWDWEANTGLDPSTLTFGSNKKVWWICHLCGHKWQTTIYHRAQNGRSCPICHHGRWIKVQRSLTSQIDPNIAQDWHPTKNGKLLPEMFTKGSRFQAWWKCHICGKEIKRSIKNYRGCVDCHREDRLSEKCIAKRFPELIKSWHPTKNGKLTPYDVFCSDKKFWWKCDKCGYEWKARVDNRAHNRGCPCCANKVLIVGKNDLQTTHPEIAREWHPTKNGKLTPKEVSFGNHKKVWWLCPHGHEYLATINHRTGKNSTSCPVCYSGRQTSFAEQAFYYYIKKLYPDAINRYKADFLGKMELDVFIPSIRIAIEYDGEAWHKNNKAHQEQKKYQKCKKNDIYLIRLKEKDNSAINNADACYIFPDLYLEKNLERIIPKILSKIDYSINRLLRSENIIPLIKIYDVDIKRDKQKILKEYSTEYKKGSFGELYPEIAKEWHPTKNEGLTPYMFKPMSDHKVWWLCPVCGHEYETTIGHRTVGHGCRKCGIEKSTQAKRKAVNMIDPKTNEVIQTFISISDASRKMKISSGNIGMVLKGIRPKAGGYIWRYTDEQENKKYLKDNSQLDFDFEK